MLLRLLAIIGRGGLQQPSRLAAELGVPADLLAQMVLDLERLGYLAPGDEACGPEACGRCHQPCLGRTLAADGRLWAVTAKGARALEREHSEHGLEAGQRWVEA